MQGSGALHDGPDRRAYPVAYTLYSESMSLGPQLSQQKPPHPPRPEPVPATATLL